MKRDDLKNYKYLVWEVSALRRQIADLEETVAPVAQWSDMPKAVGGVSDPVAEIVAKKEEMKARYIERLRVLLEEKERIDSWMLTLDGRDKRVVTTLYVEGLSWMPACEKLGISHFLLRTILNRVTEK